MRIVAGTHRGRPLVAPKGHSTRPTADRTRQAMFNILEHAPWGGSLAGLRVLDLYAGSGALGIEALSRGATFCLFVDSDRDARDAIAQNLDSLGLSERAAVVAFDASRLGARPDGGEFHLAFLDPPYKRSLCEPALAGLANNHWLANRAVVVVERGASEPPLDTAGFATLDARIWGVANVHFLKPHSATPE